ncbi:NIPSNAP family protein [Streptomyces sp. NBC_01476]|uniref:NIPSNAP family protein n=1 Tax=Streptomyces sp. NBC_01476 TaxID=2903881 RepID=UPI002E361B23|nr:NIPSNAP family protein [Streptomyces sp. NBC_01476]
MPRTTQLRTYTVREGMLDEWVERWRSQIVPLRLELGFEIGGAWVDRERNQFVWLISYEGPETFAERNARYWASTAREKMDLDPDDYLVRTEDRVVEEVVTD